MSGFEAKCEKCETINTITLERENLIRRRRITVREFRQQLINPKCRRGDIYANENTQT
jgi:hypothetical protein